MVRAKQEHWIRKEWPTRENMVVGGSNIIRKPLVGQEKIILPPTAYKLLNIILRLIKQFVKILDSPYFETNANKCMV